MWWAVTKFIVYIYVLKSHDGDQSATAVEIYVLNSHNCNRLAAAVKNPEC